ncbi:restriction endonuclease subunit S, partial [Neglectibacter timonensis]|uniref:restriction endonuclease subunit S n=1 Tax=Neglectibacter timonensis TaxID=1776382 RepID=UPI0039912278
MKSNYKKLGNYIEACDCLNTSGEITLLQGISNEKYFQECKSNKNGIDLCRYRICEKGWFAYNRATTRNGEKISIAYREEETCIVSPSYKCFRIIDEQKLDPKYLLLWFNRNEFDRYARYKSHGSAHEYFEFNEMCDVEIPVPPIEKQRSIVKAYKTITDRITLKKRINDNLEAQMRAYFKEYIA